MAKSIQVSISQQQLSLVEGDHCVQQYSVSTAKKGAGQREGSEKTPLGKHRVAEKVGGDQPLGSVFVARKPTGEIYSPELSILHPDRDWILTRILWLRGMEPGINQGGHSDTYRRMIYIHGSPDARPMGEPHSHGCITLHSKDMLEVYEWAQVGTPVIISS